MAADPLQEVVDLFKRFDTNHDGLLDFDELRELLLAIGLQPTEIGSVWGAVDANGDGKVQYEEFLNWIWNESSVVQEKLIGSTATAKRALLRINETLIQQGAKLEDLFAQECQTTAGLLYKHEVFAMMLKYDPTLTESVLEQAFATFDWDHNGAIDRDEFLHLFRTQAYNASAQTAEGAAATTVDVTVSVPHIVTVGQLLSISHDGATYQVAVPPGAVPGGTFVATLQLVEAAAPAAAVSSTVSVVVPAGVYAGQNFTVEHGGMNYTVMCPAGSGPGSTVNVQVG